MAQDMLVDKQRGMSVIDIAAKYGVTRQTVYNWMREYFERYPAPEVAQYREEQNMLLDSVQGRFFDELESASILMLDARLYDEEGNALDRPDPKRMDVAARIHNAALNGLLRVAERRARLNGLDAPVKANVTVTVNTALDAELEEMAREVRARVYD
jgi:transposase-like protein